MDLPIKLIELAEKLLTGQITRDELIKMDRPALAYGGITMMLAGRYGVTSDDRVPGGLANALKDVVVVARRESNYNEWPHDPSEVMREAAKLGLYAKTPRPRHVPVTLTPPAQLRALIATHQNHSAVTTFFEDVAKAVEREKRWIAENRANRQKKSAVEYASYILDKFEDLYDGTIGLDVLQSELDKRKWW